MQLNFHDDIFAIEQGVMMRFLRLQFPLHLDQVQRKQAISMLSGFLSNNTDAFTLTPEERRTRFQAVAEHAGYTLVDVNARMLGGLGMRGKHRG
jgi:hypothetical protein